ncbi:MAG: TetR/AcrR family transcriptional regulator [Actinomycetota bacterium]
MPKAADPEERRAEIVAAAARLIAEEGPEAMTMRKIATEAGCTIGRLNHWFDSKDDLVEAVLEHASSAAVTRSGASMRGEETRLDDVLAQFLPLDDTRVDELRVWLVFWALSIGRPNLRAGYARRVDRIRGQLQRHLARTHPEADPEALADLLMATVDGIAVNALAEPGYWTKERQLETLRRLLGLAVDTKAGATLRA